MPVQRPGILGLMALLALAPAAFGADTLLLHGHIFKGTEQAPWAQALAITGGRVEAIGTDAEMLKHRRSHTRVIDLKGRTVIPGIVDSHVHSLYGSLALHGFNLSTPETSITPDQPKVLGERIRAYAASHPEEAILFGRADFGTVPPTTPTREVLDGAVADRPIVIHNTSEHALWVNGAALALAGIGDTPLADRTEEAGVIRDASGHPSGVLLEAAMEPVARAVAATLPREFKLAVLREGLHYLNHYGITSVVNATGDLGEIGLYATLHERGELTVRTRTSFGAVAVPHRLTPQLLADLEQARTLYHDDWVAANLVKFFADGGSGLLAPLVYEPAAYRALVLELDRRGFQIMTHALRSDSVRLILDTYAEIGRQNGARDRRLRIEHADVVEEGDLGRFAPLGVIVDMQPAFCCGPSGMNYDARVTAATDRWQSFARAGTRLAFSSDWPCTWPPDPFVGIQQAVTRHVWRSEATANVGGQPLDGAGQGGAVEDAAVYSPEERVTVEQAVRAYTAGGAYAAFHEDRVGTLETGKEADLAILSQDPFSVPASTIARTQVVLTMVGGRIVYESPPTR